MARTDWPPSANDLKSMYIAGMSLLTIACIFDVSYDAVHYQCLKAGIRLRPKGAVKGTRSHNWKGGVKRTNDYTYVYLPGHSHATKSGYVLKAVVNWEEANGMPFPLDKVPHHEDLDKQNDMPENIIPMTKSKHKRLHALMRPRVNGKYGK